MSYKSIAYVHEDGIGSYVHEHNLSLYVHEHGISISLHLNLTMAIQVNTSRWFLKLNNHQEVDVLNINIKKLSNINKSINNYSKQE